MTHIEERARSDPSVDDGFGPGRRFDLGLCPRAASRDCHICSGALWGGFPENSCVDQAHLIPANNEANQAIFDVEYEIRSGKDLK